ncbi:MAG: ComEC/Rec2 family competence protein, partial [Actinomycetales bacterium]
MLPPQGAGRQGRHGALLPLTLALLCAGAVCFSAAFADGLRHDGELLSALGPGGAVKAVVTITDDVHASAGPSGPGAVPAGWYAGALLRSAELGGRSIPARSPVLLTGTGSLPTLQPGDSLEVTGTISALPPGGAAVAVLRLSSAPRGLSGAPDTVVLRLRADLRSSAAWLPADAAGLLPGMVTGDRSAVPAGLADAMKLAGLTHLTAVSGANCTLVLASVILLARTLRLPRAAVAVTAG